MSDAPILVVAAHLLRCLTGAGGWVPPVDDDGNPRVVGLWRHPDPRYGLSATVRCDLDADPAFAVTIHGGPPA